MRLPFCLPFVAKRAYAVALLAGLAAVPVLAHAKTLVVCTEASPEGFDVVQYNSLTTSNASGDVIFNQLLRYDEASAKLQPSLADSWKVSEDGLHVTFHLRPNVQFQTTPYFKPTRALDADDVVFTFKRMLDPDNAWHKIAGPAGFPHAQSLGLTKLITAVDKVDAQTVQFTLAHPDATFAAVLTMPFASIYSAEYAHQLETTGKQTALNSEPIGTGPFTLKQYTPDALVRYTANPSYWGPKPKVDQLVYAITPDASVRAQKVKAGECQIALSPKPQDVLAVEADKANKSEKVIKASAFATAFVAINTEHKPLNDPKVRQALNLAFDRDTYLKSVFDGTASAAVNPYPTSTWSYDKQIHPYPHDVTAAKKLLAAAGFPNGFATTIWVRPSGSALNPNPKLGAELLQADLAKIGVTAAVKVIEWGELIKDAKQGQHDLLFMGWSGDNGDPDNFLSPLFSCASLKSGINFSRFCDPTLDGLITSAKTTADVPHRTALYMQAQKIIHDQALWIPLAYPTVFALTQSNVSGYHVSAFGRQDFSDVVLK